MCLRASSLEQRANAEPCQRVPLASAPLSLTGIGYTLLATPLLAPLTVRASSRLKDAL